jgi:RNA polymerase sigma factor (TIGR02999 family)
MVKEDDFDDESVSELLARLNGGQPEVQLRLMNIVYGELRRRAAIYLANERAGHTLQPTALVHEAYLRLVQQDISWQGRAHFFAVAAQVMRNLLVDNARAHRARKRGGANQQVTLDDAVAFEDARSVDLIALDEALTRLAAFDPRQSRIVELRFFGGLNLDEVAEVLHISDRTVKRDWRMARSWLKGQLQMA